jgi:hypothetical protein
MRPSYQSGQQSASDDARAFSVELVESTLNGTHLDLERE